MLKLSLKDILNTIISEKPINAICEDYSFTIKISEYVPYICAAVHDGHQFRKSLWDNCLHSEYERWYEEDPCTKQMVQSMPIVLAARDSRFEYDINRQPNEAIYDDAWGKQLWKAPLHVNELQLSLQKHANFYKVVHALINQIELRRRLVLVFDMHSYNWKRWDRKVPTWNLGTDNIDNAKYGKIVEAWKEKLSALSLPNGIKSTAKINDTFHGNGYFLKYITQNFKNTLVLATEIAKVYCNEDSGVIYPEVVDAVEIQLKEIIPQMVKEFGTVVI